MREQKVIVAAVAVGQQGGVARSQIVAVDLIPLASAGVLLKDKRLAVRQVLGA